MERLLYDANSVQYLFGTLNEEFMSLSFSCRVAAYFFCLSVYFSNLFANQTPESFSITATNTLTSSQDSLSLCRDASENTSKRCYAIQTILPDGNPVRIHNPVALATNDNNFFIANYGMVQSSLGTSFLLKCEIPVFGNTRVTCIPILNFYSATHITGMHVIGQKLFLVRSSSIPFESVETGEEYFLNSNFLKACNIPVETDENQRINECGNNFELFANNHVRISKLFNTSMEIKFIDNALYIEDPLNRKIHKCALPLPDNTLTSCENLPYENLGNSLTIKLPKKSNF